MLFSSPVLPDAMSRLALSGVPGRWGRVDVEPKGAGDGSAAASAVPPVGTYSLATAREVFEHLPEHVDPARIANVRGRLRFDIVGAGTWTVTLDGATAVVTEGRRGKPDCTIEVVEEVFLDLVRGDRNGDTAFLQGLIKVWGDLGLAQRFTRTLF